MVMKCGDGVGDDINGGNVMDKFHAFVSVECCSCFDE